MYSQKFKQLKFESELDFIEVNISSSKSLGEPPEQDTNIITPKYRFNLSLNSLNDPEVSSAPISIVPS